jgi:outer membrane biosynthesis protein TonB
VKALRRRSRSEVLRAPGLAGSAALHLLIVATFVAAGGLPGRRRLPPVYRVTLVAPLGPAAPPVAAAPPAAAKPAAPAPPRPEPRPRTPVAPAQHAKAPPAAAPAAPRQRPAPAAAPPAAPPTSPAGAPGGTDQTTIRTEGVEFPFPVYLHNLVAQVYRRWRPPPSNALLEAEVLFLVHRDGSVSGLQFIHRSGSFAFDLEAQGAIEAAGRAGSFGPLPAGFGPDVLPVSFFFNPRSPR